MDSASKLPFSLKTIALRLSVQVLLFVGCLALSKYLVLSLTGSGLFEQVITSSNFAKLAFIHPQLQVWYDFLPSLTVVLVILPLIFCLQLLNGHFCLSPYEKKHATYFWPLTELLTLPVMLILALIALLEVLANLAKGVPFATIRAGFPGWNVFCGSWLYKSAVKMIPSLKVPVGAVFNTMAFAWFTLLILTTMADCSCAFYMSLATGPIFGSVCGMSLAFAARAWDLDRSKSL